VTERAAGRIAPEDMVAELEADQRTISTTLRALAAVAEAAGDPATNDLAVERVAAHDKFAWMLGAHLR
jgi:starvation-inducible DNA-binding protein